MASAPIGCNDTGIERVLTTKSTAILVPFCTQELFMPAPAIYYGLNALSNNMIMRWSSFFVTLTRKSFDIIMPAFSFQMVSYIHLMNVGGYDCNTHIHNP